MNRNRRKFTRREFLGAGAGLGAAAVLHARLGRALAGSGATSAPGSSTPEIAIDESTCVGKEGFYRVAKSTDGHWWLLRPDGTPTLYKGSCAICRGFPGNGGNPYWKTTRKVYGNDDKAFFRDSVKVLERLRFNAFGLWSYIRSPGAPYQGYGWPFVQHFHARHIYPKATVGGPATVHVDAFDPDWRRAYDKACRRRCPKLRDNRNLLGYFTDNEPFWGQPGPDHVWGKTKLEKPMLLQTFLALPSQRAGHKEAWKFVLARHQGSVEKLAGDWGVAFDSPVDLRRKTEAGTALDTAAFGRDHEAFTRHFAQTYFRVTSETIRRHDPNHLILGNRHAGRWKVHGKTVLGSYDRRWVDVLSMNCYGYDFPGRIQGYYQHAEMPILNGEFNWVGFVNWGKYTRSEPFTDEEKQRNRELARQALEGAFAHPALIGYTWFKWYSGPDRDEPAAGVVTDDNEINRFNAPLFKRIHPRLEEIAAGRKKPYEAKS